MHNPTVEDVQNNGLVEVLEKIRSAGKARFIGVSSTAPHLPVFAHMGVFDTFQIPYSLLERTHEHMIQEAATLGAGIIIRGGIAKGHRNSGDRLAKWDQAKLDDCLDGMDRHEFALRFTLSHPACHTTIVGSSDIDHIRSNIASAMKGPLSSDIYACAKERMAQMGENPVQ